MVRRILHVVGDSQFGGGAVLILRIAQAAAERGGQVDVLSTNSQFNKAIETSGLGVVSLDCIWREIRPLRDLYGLFVLYRFLKNKSYDIVHTHTSKAGLIGRAAAFFAGTPVIIHTVHGFAFHEESPPWVVRFYSALERLAAKWCNKIVTVSNYHRTWALNLGISKPDHILAIPNGISPQRVVPAIGRDDFRASLGIRPQDLVLVSAGRLAPQKGIEYLIDAVKILVDSGVSNLRVLIAGDGPLRAFLEDKTKEVGLQQNFIFLGFRSDVADILNAGDIAVMPTEREGLSIALLEAMAMGKPIVTTVIGSNLEVTENGQHARLVNPKDSRALALAIREFVSDAGLAKRLGESARSHFQKIYTEDVMLNSYMDLYGSLLKSSNAR